KNDRGYILQVSHYQPVPEERPRKKLPCVIYCHGNCGCRLDAVDCLRILLPYNITLVSLDFSGSGLSEGTEEHFILCFSDKRSKENMSPLAILRRMTWVLL